MRPAPLFVVGGWFYALALLLMFFGGSDWYAVIALVLGAFGGVSLGLGTAAWINGQPEPEESEFPLVLRGRHRRTGLPCVQCGERHSDIADCTGHRCPCNGACACNPQCWDDPRTGDRG